VNKKTIRDIRVVDKRILLRVDYNVSFAQNGQVLDDGGIVNTKPTIDYLVKRKARVFILSHLGRPEGKVVKEYSLKRIVSYLEKILNRKISFTANYRTLKDQARLKNLSPGEVVLLENTRFHPEESQNDPQFCQRLARLGDLYVNDCFGASHRHHCSTVGLAGCLPAVAGLLLEKEVDLITDLFQKPERPFVVIIGGVKVQTKHSSIKKLRQVADQILIGGALIKDLKPEPGLVLPKDVVVANTKEGKKIGVFPLGQVPKGGEILDIGPKTRVEFSQLIKKAKTIIWNGPLGLFERPAFSKGSEAVYQAIVSNRQAISVVGGGDTLAFLRGKKHLENLTHISTGGGAMLELIEKGTLPGIEALDDKN
jgi:phosphoglycerate kinase